MKHLDLLCMLITFPHFTSFLHLSFLLFFSSCLSDLNLLCRMQRRNHIWQQLCCFTVSFSCSFWFPVTPFSSVFSTLLFPLLKLRWNLSVVVSAAVRLLLLLFLSLTLFCQYSSLFFLPSLLCTFVFFLLHRDERLCFLLPCTSYGCLSPFLSPSCVFQSVLSLALLVFLCRDEKITLVCSLLSSLWEFFLWFFATCCSSDGSGQTNWPAAHC